MSTKERERLLRRAAAGTVPRVCEVALLRSAARLAARARASSAACARASRSLALACFVSASAACVVSPADNSNGNASQANGNASQANGNAPQTNAANSSSAAAPTPSLEVAPFPVATATPAEGATPAPAPPQSAATPGGAGADIPASLLIPVAGVRVEDLRDTFTEARSEGRVHNSIDIIAPKGTPVLAAADGRVVKLFQSVKGGTTVYQRGTDGKTIYYYAHLAAYADGLAENQEVRRGDVIGYVGDTGNAKGGPPHLHFEIRPRNGPSVNPYPSLRNAC